MAHELPEDTATHRAWLLGSGCAAYRLVAGTALRSVLDDLRNFLSDTIDIEVRSMEGNIRSPRLQYFTRPELTRQHIPRELRGIPLLDVFDHAMDRHPDLAQPMPVTYDSTLVTGRQGESYFVIVPDKEDSELLLDQRKRLLNSIAEFVGFEGRFNLNRPIDTTIAYTRDDALVLRPELPGAVKERIQDSLPLEATAGPTEFYPDPHNPYQNYPGNSRA